MDRTKPPQTPELPVYKLPPVFETRLPNGLTVLLVEDTRFPMATARLGFEAGAKFDPPELRGLSETTAALLTEGSTHRTARQIAEETASIGGSLHAGSSADSLLLAGSALSENLPHLLDLMADAARNANFPDDEVALRKQNRQQELLAQRADAGYLADEKFYGSPKMSSVTNPITSTTSTTTTPTNPSISTTQADALGNQQVFLQLLVAQMQNQDPLNPTDSATMVTQLATFSQLEQTIAVRQDTDAIAAVVAPSSSSSSSAAAGSSGSSDSSSTGTSGSTTNP